MKPNIVLHFINEFWVPEKKINVNNNTLKIPCSYTFVMLMHFGG